MRAVRVWIAAAALAAGLFGSSARAADLLYTTGPGSNFVGWTVPLLAIRAGDTIEFANPDIAAHDFVAACVVATDPECGPSTQPWCVAYTPFGRPCPIFFSKLIGFLGPGPGLTDVSVPVQGLENVRPGVSYRFVCTIHPVMKGTLTVLPA